ncbi:MAG: tyrosine--tRNA ligase [Phycisphaerae bacterium]
MPKPNIDEMIQQLRRRCEQIVPEADLRRKLARSEATGKPLRIKLGMDPTAPDVHLGHAVPLKVVRAFQEWGHKAVIIIGDYTARVGDPAGRNSTRPMLTGEAIDANARTYIEQVGKILLTDPEHLEIRFNGEWLGKMDLVEIIRLAARKSVAQLLERDTFAERYKKGVDIRLHEFLYPLLQGWDSVCIDADVEMGGLDQLFNNLVGRDFQKAERPDDELAGQVVIVTPLLVGLDGHEKMSKSKGNYVGVTDPAGGAGGMFGKVMSISDEQMPTWYRLLTNEPEASWQAAIAASPRDAKVALAKNVVAQFHDAAAADQAEKDFVTATHGGVPDDIPEMPLGPGPHNLVEMLVKAGMAQTNSEALRKIREGAVKLDGERLGESKGPVEINPPAVLQLGKKRFVRLV